MEFNSITETQKKIKSKKISILELNKIFIDRINKNKNINAFIFFDEDLITKRCKELDNLKDDTFKLKGIPLGIKDLFCTIGMPTTAGSKILCNFKPTYESHVTSKLLNQGSIFLGKAKEVSQTFCLETTEDFNLKSTVTLGFSYLLGS